MELLKITTLAENFLSEVDNYQEGPWRHNVNARPLIDLYYFLNVEARKAFGSQALNEEISMSVLEDLILAQFSEEDVSGLRPQDAFNLLGVFLHLQKEDPAVDCRVFDRLTKKYFAEQVTELIPEEVIIVIKQLA